MRWKEKVVAGYLVFIIVNLAIIDYLVWKGVEPQVLNEGLPPDVAEALLLSFSILLTIFLLVVYLEQSKFMEKQTKIFEVDKLPMLIFKKIKEGERAFEIFNASKYPVKIEFDSFIPEEHYEKRFNEQQRGKEGQNPPQEVRFRQMLREVYIYPDQKRTVPDKSKSEADIDVPGVLRIKASNVFYPDDFTLTYEYDIKSGRFRLVGNGFQIGYRGWNNTGASVEHFYEFANKFTPYLVIYSAMMNISIALMAFSDKLAKLTSIGNWVFALIGFLFGISGILTLIGLASRIWSEIKLFRPLRENLVRFFAFLAVLLPSGGLILFFLLLFKEVLVKFF
ncbi:hypothetical protein [Geoglobus acetivorans]|uniref:Uncharacterized protein n=1 Tax=Geoglobus acetivorans TaxID=565033 RepID=A0A0A7GHA0_GEOAI|nr:hypothetical protein GACE_1256 [Geoglobus acetivorans]